MEKLLSIGDIARMLDLSIATIYKYVCQKKIPYLKIGSRVLFDEDKLDKWLQSKEVEPISVKEKERMIKQKKIKDSNKLLSEYHQSN